MWDEQNLTNRKSQKLGNRAANRHLYDVRVRQKFVLIHNIIIILQYIYYIIHQYTQ